MPESPYRTPSQPPPAPNHRDNPRWLAIVLAIVSAAVSLFFGWQSLVIYGFSTMVDPQLAEDERSRMIADRFLYGDGPFQVVFVCHLLFMATTGLFSAILLLASAIVPRLSLTMAIVIACIGGGITTALIVAYFASF